MVVSMIMLLKFTSVLRLSDWLINQFECFFIMQHLIEIQDRDTISYSYDWSQEIFTVHVPIDSSTHYLAF